MHSSGVFTEEVMNVFTEEVYVPKFEVVSKREKT